MATHSSILAWEIPWTEEPGGLQSHVLQRVRDDGSDLAYIYTHTHVYIYANTHMFIILSIVIRRNHISKLFKKFSL